MRNLSILETLIVISVIALLIGVLLPALGTARKTAKEFRRIERNKIIQPKEDPPRKPQVMEGKTFLI